MDQTNPLAGLTHKRRLSALGPGGLSRERAGFEVRDVHPATTAGCARSRRRKARTSASSATCRRTPASTGSASSDAVPEGARRRRHRGDRIPRRRRRGPLRHRPGQRPGRRPGPVPRREGAGAARRSEVAYVDPHEVDYMDVSPKQIVSVATSLIPFLEHDDANRALMGANMQRQAVPLLRSTAVHRHGRREPGRARDAGDLVVADDTGTVAEVSGDSIVVDYQKNGRTTHRCPSSAARTRAPASTEAVGRDRRSRPARATCSPTGRPHNGELHWARTFSWRSCPGRVTTTRTPS